VPHGKVWIDPVLPAPISRLRVDRIPLGGRRVTVQVDRHGMHAEGMGPDVQLVHSPRNPSTA
jgi:hypothetical protein